MSRSGRNTRRLTATEIDLTVTRQLALVVGTATNERSREECDSSLEELVQLVDTAGADVVERVVQSRERPHPATYVGSGKAQEIKMLTQALDVDVVVFDDELAPNQQRNLEKILECDVVDRTALILDIFAQHATTPEGMVQVELAQLRYRMPRLSGRGLQLSQQGGGIGTRGPGETLHEVDRRRIRTRMAQLERELDRLARDDPGAVAVGPAVLVHEPRHDLRVGVDIRGGDVLVHAEHMVDGRGEPPGGAFEFGR